MEHNDESHEVLVEDSIFGEYPPARHDYDEPGAGDASKKHQGILCTYSVQIHL